MTKIQARRELKKHIKEIMKDATRMAVERVDKLELVGVDVVGDHMKAAGQYTIPKDFIVAFADELKFQYGHPYPTRAAKQRIKRYALNM